jgi:hypothetical protein
MSISSSKQKVNVVSCSFGEQRELYEFPPQHGGYEIITSFYTDENFPSREKCMLPRLKGKIPKMLQYNYEKSDYYIWIDSKFNIISPNFIGWMLETLSDSDIALFPHPCRSSIKSELDFMLSEMKNERDDIHGYLSSRYNGEGMIEQVDKYLKDSNFRDDKLFACGMFIYRRELIIKHPNFFTDWMIENVVHSIQDQLSIPYLLYKHGIKYTTFNQHITNNEYIIYK